MKLYSRKDNRPLEEYLLDNAIIKRGSRIALAVSGGADSVAMLLFFLSVKEEWDLQIAVCHMEHGIRGEESLEDAEFVRSLCDKYGVDFHIKSVDVPRYAKENGLSVEEAARKLRYEFLAEASEEYIAVAHNYEDNAETVLFNLIRGSGPDGLCGMEEKRSFGEKILIRPLLTVSREDILKYLKEENVGFCVDSTNSDENYSRNAIRNIVFPELLKINNKTVSHINNAAMALGEFRDFKTGLFKEELSKLLVPDKEGSGISVSGLLARDSFMRRNLIMAWVEANMGKHNVTRQHYLAIESLLDAGTGKQTDLPGHVVIRDYDSLKIVKRSQIDLKNRTETFGSVDIDLKKLSDDENLIFLKDGLEYELSVISYKKDATIPRDLYTKWFDYDKIRDKFSLRGYVEGDYFTINSQNNKKPFNRFCIDAKIPCEERKRIPLFTCDNHIVWAVGHRISEAFKVDDDTLRILQIIVRECCDA